jgi:hypothetical protein
MGPLLLLVILQEEQKNEGKNMMDRLRLESLRSRMNLILYLILFSS